MMPQPYVTPEASDAGRPVWRRDQRSSTGSGARSGRDARSCPLWATVPEGRAPVPPTVNGPRPSGPLTGSPGDEAAKVGATPSGRQGPGNGLVTPQLTPDQEILRK